MARCNVVVNAALPAAAERLRWQLNNCEAVLVAKAIEREALLISDLLLREEVTDKDCGR